MNAATEFIPQACPARGLLLAFDSGRLDDPQAEAVAAHLSTCPPCGEAFEQLQHEEPADELVGHLRRGLGAADDEPEPAAVARIREVADEWPAPIANSRDTATIAAMITQPNQLLVGPYRIAGVISRGGMGIVYRAEHTALKRPAAVKMIRDGAYAQPETLARFRVEAAAVARLNHPNIVRIYDFSEFEGVPFLGMELVEGGTLAKRFKEGPPSYEEAARLAAAVAGAVQFAHDHKVLHRDLKPSNVLLTEDGTPKVADFGLAKILDDDESLTQTDAVLGTPSYMAPEQATGQLAAIGPWTDVYAIGAILYEALTGRPPYRGETKAETLRLVWEGKLPAPSELRPDVPPGLEGICLKAVARMPASRYESPAALAADLGRWLDGAKPKAKPRSKARAFFHRTRAYWISAATGVVLAVGAVGAKAYSNAAREAHERVGREITAELAAGRSVELIGEKGLPRWYLWRQGEEQAKLTTDPATGACAVESPRGLAMLDLLPEPPPLPYRVTAEMLTQHGGPACFCGLYYGAVRRSSRSDAADFYRTLAFSNRPMNGLALTERVIPPQNQYFRLMAVVNYYDSHSVPACNSLQDCSPVAWLPAREPAWHPVELLVRADRTAAAVAGASVTSPAALEDGSMAKILRLLRGRYSAQKLPSLHGGDFPDTNAGHFGLLVESNSVAFRSVRVEPLPAPLRSE